MKNLQLPKANEIKYFETAEYARKIEKARHKMRPKPFTERFSNLHVIAQIGTFFFPAISVITGISFLFSYLFDSLGYFFLSIGLALSFLLFVEYTKNILLNNGLDTFFSNSGKTGIVFLFAMLFSLASFVMSYNGAEMLVKGLDKKQDKIKTNILSTVSDKENEYQRLIDKENAKISKINKKATKQWNGMLTPRQSDRVIQYEKNIEHFRKNLNNEKTLLRTDKDKQLSTAENKTIYNSYFFKIIAGINEFLTILSILFIQFYTFKTVREDIDLNEFRETPDKYVDFENKKRFEVAPLELNEAAAKTPNKIGFQGSFKTDEKTDEPPKRFESAGNFSSLKTTNRNIDFLRKHRIIVRAIKTIIIAEKQALANSEIKQIQNHSTAAKQKSRTLIREVYRVVCTVGLSKIDLNGRVLPDIM